MLYAKKAHTNHYVCQFARNKESDLDTLYITHFQCGLNFIWKKESKPFLVVRFGFGPSQSKRSLRSALRRTKIPWSQLDITFYDVRIPPSSTQRSVF